MFDREGKKVQTITCEKFSCPIGVAVDKDDNIYASNNGNSSLFKFSKEGKLKNVVERNCSYLIIQEKLSLHPLKTTNHCILPTGQTVHS